MIRLSEKDGRRLIGSGKKSKFNVDTSEAGKEARTFNGRTFDSQAECRYAAMLEQRKRVGDIRQYWCQQEIPLTINGVRVAKMVCDFKLLHQDDSLEYCEVKGFETAVYRLKLKILRALYPAIKFTVIPAKDVR